MSPSRPQRIEALDGLRGVIALEIVLRHLAAIYQVTYHPAIAALMMPLRHGPVGYPLFFVLTGFGLAGVLLGREERGETTRLAAFLAERWWRLAPIYYLALALCVLVPFAPGDEGRHRVQTDPIGPATIADHLLFVHGLRPGSIYAISPPFWSMSLTAQFCVALPLLHRALSRFGPGRATAALLTLWLAGRAAFEWHLGLDSLVGSGFVLYRLPSFLLGMWLAHRLRRRRAAATTTPCLSPARQAGLAGACVLAAVGLQEWSWGWPIPLLYAIGYTLAVSAVIESSARSGRLASFLSRPALLWLGAASYAIYISHDLVLSRWIGLYRAWVAGPGMLADLIMLTTGVALALAVGRLFFTQVERPLAAWSRRRGRAVAGREVRRPALAG